MERYQTACLTFYTLTITDNTADLMQHQESHFNTYLVLIHLTSSEKIPCSRAILKRSVRLKLKEIYIYIYIYKTKATVKKNPSRKRHKT